MPKTPVYVNKLGVYCDRDAYYRGGGWVLEENADSV